MALAMCGPNVCIPEPEIYGVDDDCDDQVDEATGVENIACETGWNGLFSGPPSMRCRCH